MLKDSIDIRAQLGEEEFTKRLRAARNRASWELGDPTWAGVIIGAFLHPEEDAAALERARALDTSGEE